MKEFSFFVGRLFKEVMHKKINPQMLMQLHSFRQRSYILYKTQE